ncbi:uncharacterized protein PHALS_15422 [Plasmopara halstedii]|uniref:Uncharacterized protein n=1 Tax=Plasmopara halstedii TaxID=4781 RepID=A0A0N7L4Z5_PLAHL|nr:uncharacterized protein PHALS_15422 [Plasmopara halstedii]CEG40051.1 hypothetical protein PHALS_15422 [Plasmopara halstedii]|eukprot:XP_024576420.1 hypothetical protein PHALS_15422 [Plasmopara halstedii]
MSSFSELSSSCAAYHRCELIESQPAVVGDEEVVERREVAVGLRTPYFLAVLLLTLVTCSTWNH